MCAIPKSAKAKFWGCRELCHGGHGIFCYQALQQNYNGSKHDKLSQQFYGVA
jgi:hypothetical protein